LVLSRRLEERARQLCSGERWDQLEAEVVDGALDPWSAVDEMLAGFDA
jgi:LAO/AO transport system kinase